MISALTKLANFALVMAIVFFTVPVALPGVELTLIQSAAITLLAFVAKVLLSPEAPEIYLINGNDKGDAE
jgi:hypothetical protein